MAWKELSSGCLFLCHVRGNIEIEHGLGRERKTLGSVKFKVYLTGREAVDQMVSFCEDYSKLFSDGMQIMFICACCPSQNHPEIRVAVIVIPAKLIIFPILLVAVDLGAVEHIEQDPIQDTGQYRSEQKYTMGLHEPCKDE